MARREKNPVDDMPEEHPTKFEAPSRLPGGLLLPAKDWAQGTNDEIILTLDVGIHVLSERVGLTKELRRATAALIVDLAQVLMK